MKKLIFCMFWMGTMVAQAAVSHLYSTFGVRPDGVWTNGNCNLTLGESNFYHSGYVYTNSVGVVHQFNLERRLPKSTDIAAAIELLKNHEQILTKAYVLTSFKPHVDSNPKRYLWSEESSMIGCGDWLVRLYLVRDEKSDELVAQASIWSPMLAKVKSKITLEIVERDAAKPLKIYCDHELIAISELEKRLAVVAKKDKKMPIFILVAQKSPHQDLVSVLDICYKHGLFSVSIFTK